MMIASHFVVLAMSLTEAIIVYGRDRGQAEEFENCPEQRISAKFPSRAKCWKNLAKMFQSWQSTSAPARQAGQVSRG